MRWHALGKFRERRTSIRTVLEFRIGAELIVVADAASVSSDAGSIHHEATVISGTVLSGWRKPQASQTDASDRSR